MEMYIKSDHEHFLKEYESTTDKIQVNLNVIKRNDKLVVDQQQKNELIQIQIAVTDEKVILQDRQHTRCDILVKEANDKRRQLGQTNDRVKLQIEAYNQHLIIERERLA